MDINRRNLIQINHEQVQMRGNAVELTPELNELNQFILKFIKRFART